MKLIEVPLGGRTYYARFSLRVMDSLENRSIERGGNGNAQAELASMLDSGRPSDLFWILLQLIEAGRKCAELEGLTPPPPLTYDELLDLAGMEDMSSLYQLAAETIITDSKTTVQTEPAKNGEATPEQ